MKKNFIFKRVLTLVLAVMMLVTAMPVGVLADPAATGTQNKKKYTDDDYSITYNDKIIRKADYINKVGNLPIEPKKTENATDLVANPTMPKLYTVHADFKVQRGDDLVVAYQPYIATAGDAISQGEKNKINKLIKFPVLDGYTSATPKGEATINYDFIEKRALSHNNLVGDEYKGHFDYVYTPKKSSVKVKHVFQDINDFNKYGLKPGDTEYRISTQYGLTGTSLTIQPLPDFETRGYVPEDANINTQVPESPDDFIVEYRYNLAHYTVNYDTGKEGSPLPTRTLFYNQIIPKLNDLTTKDGAEFLGWKPSIELKGTLNGVEKTFNANEIIKVATGSAIKNLDANLIMPASNVTFTAVWKDKEKADYAVQFWAEKADHVDNASLQEKYEYMGTRVYKDKDTGSRPDLNNESVKDIVFPDLDQARLQKIWAGTNFYGDKYLYLNKFYVYNQALTADQNKDPENASLVKSVSPTGKTVYNIYYDRQEYELYFTKSNALGEGETFYPEIYVPDGDGGAKLAGGPGNPYHFSARFNQLMLGWPNDAMQTKGFDGKKQSFGWGPNYGIPNWPLHLDTPPYRLNADEFLDMPNYDNWGGYVSQIDNGDGTYIDVKKDPRFKDEPYKALSFGIKQEDGSMPHHMDFWMDGFKSGETIIRYDLYRSKADTDSPSYAPRYPQVQGFTGKRATEPAEFLDADGIGAKNTERAEVTPFPAKTYTVNGDEHQQGEMVFISAFFNNADEWGDPIVGDAFKENGYIRFKYTRNKYPLRFNYDPSKIKGDNEFNNTNSIDTFYEFPLKVLNPELVDDSTPQADREYFKENPANFLDDPKNLQKLNLTDLIFKDPKDGKLKVKRPDNLSDDMVFKGWALDPAGTKLISENASEKMPNHPVNLYAKWGDPDTRLGITFDANGGTLPNIDPSKLTQKQRTIKEGDVGNEKDATYPIKVSSDSQKAVFTVIQKQKLVEQARPTRDGYNFLGWEVLHYKKDDTTGEYTNDFDTSFKDKYKVPELYSFGNEVAGPLYLKAIWVKNDLVDVKSYHHFLDNNYKEVKQEIQPLKDRRVGSYLAAVGSRQNADRILVPKDEWGKLEDNNITTLKDSMTYKQYRALDEDHPRVNSYSQQIKIEPEKIQDQAHPDDPTKLIDNPKAKLNQFHFYYRPFRQREYKVNYLDERGRKEVEKFIEDSKKAFKDIKDSTTLDEEGKSNALKALLAKKIKDFKAIREKYAIIDQEAVKNGKRHFDARNYRPIAGWVLDDKPQQQLFFDINEDTNAFYGINETGFDEINFFYKDVRVVETNKNDPVPDGYVRVTFKAADGGSFTDKAGKAVKELYYDVVKGLRSQLLPVPQLLREGETKVNGKYYITPDNGKNFTKWDKDELLNDNTILEQNYEFTAYFDWSDLKVSSKELVSTESYIDPDDKWTNEFAPTIDELKNQLVLTKNNQVINNIDEHIVAQLFDEKGKELKTDEDVLKLLSEQNKSDTEELVRRVNIKAKVKFKDQKYKALENEKEGLGDQLEKLKKEDPVDQTKINELEQKIKDTTDAIKAHEAGLTEQELDIPVTIYKNVYEALTKTEKPLFLSEAEKGDLKDITGDYVKVTVQPTNKPTNKDAKIYYVNPYAWVKISEVDISQDASSLGFTKWTADKDKQNENNEENGVFDFDKRHMFTEDTVIKPDFSEDVKEQKDGEPKPDVPNDFVKVIVEKTEKAELKTGEAQTQTFWVNPTKVVTIPVTNPTGKTETAAAEVQAKAYIFKDWTSNETTARTWTDTIKAQFTAAETTITANYTEAKNIIPYDPEEPITRPEGYVRVKFDADPGLKLTEQKAYYVKQNSGVKLSDLAHPTYEESTGYNFDKWDKEDSLVIEAADIVVTAKPIKLDNVIPEKDDNGKPNKKPDGYKEVTFVIKDDDKVKGSIDGVAKFFVKPNEYVKIDPPATKANTGFEFGSWDKNTTIPTVYTDDTIITGSFNGLKDVIPKTKNDDSEKPEGYITVKFELEKLDGKDAGDFAHGEITEYFVNPNKDVTINQPKTSANTGYVFEKWKIGDQDFPTDAKKYTEDTTVKGTFKALEDIIPSTDPITNEKNAKPEGYVTVTFTKGDHGSSISGETIFYVNPTAGKTIGEINLKPTVIPDTGYAVNGWDKEDNYKITKDETVNADYTDVGDVIPDDGNPNTKPAGYIKVTFDTNGKGKIKGTDKTTKVVYVRPNTAVVLKGYEPEVEAQANYKFSGWDVNLSKATIYNNGDIIKAQYNNLGDISTTEKQGYVKVEFKTDARGKLVNNQGTLVDITELWIAPNKEITIPAPSVVSNPGHTFKSWDKPLTVTLTKSQETYVINAQYYNGNNIVPEIDAAGKINNKPDGYVTVTFRADDNGKLEGNKDVITYFVNPNAGIKLVELADGASAGTTQLAVPKPIPDKNYVFDNWYESLDKTNSITTDLEHVARFNKGKVTLTYDAGGADGTVPIPVIVDNGTKVRLAPATGLSKTDAKFAGWSINGSTDLKQAGDEITLTKDTTATAQWTTDKDIISYDPKEPTTRPDNTYVRVTFEAETGLSLTEQKAYYVKKNAGKTLGDAELVKPGHKEKIGYKFDKWDLPDSTKIEASDIVVTAKATKLERVIPEKDNNNQANKKPEGYKEVTFVIKTGDELKGSLEGNTKFYVNPTEYVTITPPTTKANTGFVFGAWTPDPSIPTVYKDDVTTITGSFNPLKAVVPKTKTNDSEKPAGYVTVTFEIEGDGGKIVDGEVKVYYVNPAKEVAVPQPKTIAKTGYVFEKWNQDTTAKKKYAEDTTVKGNFKKLEDIIPSTDEKGNTNAKPDGYITVTFDRGDHGSLTGQNIYYVNPNAGKTIGDTKIVKPTVTPETGYKADGWDKEDSQPITGDLTVTAKYKELDDVIPKTKNDESEKPAGYITVTFDKGEHGKELTGQVVYYVNPNKAVVLKGKAPTAVPNTGYDFARWDTTIERAIQYKDKDVIKALYNQIGSVIPKINDQTKKPDGYVTVTFDKGTNGKEITGTTVYYVDPNREVNLPAPTVIPNVGWKQKTGDDAWDNALTQTFTADKTIKAQYDPLDDIIPQKNIEGLDRPEGYKTIKFEAVHGTLKGTLVYYVNPDKDIMLLSTGESILDKADTGYTKEGGTWSEAIDELKKYTKNENIIFTYKELDNVIPEKNPTTGKANDQPTGYVKVTLKPTNKATDETKAEKVYYVNPKANVKIINKPVGKSTTDANGTTEAYTFIGWTVTRGTIKSWTDENITGTFIQDTEITAKYSLDWTNIPQAPVAKENVSTPVNVMPEAKDLIKNADDLPQGTKFEYEKSPDVQTPGDAIAKVKVTYPNDKTVIVEVPVKVVNSVIPQKGKDKPKNVPSTFVKVTFDPTDKGTLEGTKIFWVDPTKEVQIPVNKPVGKGYNVFNGWKIGNDDYVPTKDKKFTDKETTVTASYTDSENIIPYNPNEPTARPEGYYLVRFEAEAGLRLAEAKAYFVKKNATDSDGNALTLGALDKPNVAAAAGYAFNDWDKADITVIGEDNIVVTAKAKQASSPDKPDDKPSYPEVIYRDKIVEKEKIVEKIVKVGENDELLKEIRYMQGYNGKFRPYDGLTRAEAAQILANALKADGYRYDAKYALSYSDIGSKWYTDAVRVVTQANVFQGYSDGTFRPQSKITRAEWVATLRRFQDLKEVNGNAMMLRSNHWATAEVEAAYEAGWLGVYQDGIAKFDADKPITRQEVAYVSNRAFRRVLDKVYLKRSVNTLLTYKDINPSMPLYEDILCASNTLLTDNRYYKANTVVMDNLTFNIVTDYLKIQQKKFQYNTGR